MSPNVVSLASVRAERDAAAVATVVLADLDAIQTQLICYFHLKAGNPKTDIELGAAGLLAVLAERLEMAARNLQRVAS